MGSAIDATGRFTISGVAPGRYFVGLPDGCAVVDIDARELANPSVLELLVPASIKITVGEGERKTQDLRLGGS